MKERKYLRIASWLILGFALGAGLGLFLGWIAWPLEISEADPSVLERQSQADYALMIAMAYSEDQDLAEAFRRLSHLESEDTAEWFLGITIDAILDKQPSTDVGFMANLARDLGQSSPVLDPYLLQMESEEKR